MQLLNESRIRTTIQVLAGLVLAVVAILGLARSVEAAAPSSAEPFAATYGGDKSDEGNELLQTADGGYVVVGSTTSFGAGGEDAWLLKLNADGTTAWTKTYGGTEDDRAHSIVQTDDGGFVVAGHTRSFGSGLADAWLLKLNSAGGIVWEKTYGGTGTDIALDIVRAEGGGFVVAGQTDSSGAGSTDIWVIKLDDDGDVVWQKTYGGTDSDHARDIQQTVDGGYVVAGSTSSFGSDAWILKLEGDGSLEWNGLYGGPDTDEANAIQETGDGGYVVAGASRSQATGYKAWVLKLAANGSVDWQKGYSPPGRAQAIILTADGGYAVAGSTGFFSVYGDEAWMLKLNADGGLAWDMAYGGTGVDEALGIQQTAEGGYVLVGKSTSYGAGEEDAWVIKTGSAGPFYGGCSIGKEPITAVQDLSLPTGHALFSPADSSASPVDSSATVSGPAAGPDYVCSPTSSFPFAAIYDGTGPDWARDLKPTGDGGYIVAGSTFSFGAGGRDAWLLKLDGGGGVEWQKAYGKSGAEDIEAVQQTAFGGYIAVGDTTSPAGDRTDAWALVLNADGTVLWQETFGGQVHSTAKAVTVTRDRAYAFAGQRGVSGAYDAWVVKMDGLGNVVWQKTYELGQFDTTRAIQQTGDGGFVVAGWTRPYDSDLEDAWVLKLNSDGSVAWEKTYGGAGEDLAEAIVQTGDAGYVLAGSTNSFGAGKYDLWVVKLTANGSIAWQKTYGGQEFEGTYDIQQVADGGYLVAGYREAYGIGADGAWVLKLDGDGDLVWQKLFAEIGIGEAKAVAEAPGGGYAVGASVESASTDHSAYRVLKLDTAGIVCAGCSLGQDSSVVPADSSATLTNTNAFVDDTTVLPLAFTAVVSDTNVSPDHACACGLSLSKVVGPASAVDYHSTVTYTLVLSNDGGFHATGVRLTDTLPGEMTFGDWIVQPLGAQVVNGELTWQGTVTAGLAYTFMFTADHVGEYGDVVANTAQFACSALSGSAEAVLSVKDLLRRVYLPLVVRDW